MGAGNTDAFAAAVLQVNVQMTAVDNRQLILADLVTLWQIWIKIVLAREHRALRNG